MARWSLVLLAASLLGLAEGGAGSLWQSRGVTLTRTAAQSRVRCSNGICRKEVYDPERREGAASRLPKPVGRGMWGGNSTMRALGFVSPAEWRPQRVSHQLVAWQHKLSTRLVQARTDAVGSAQRFGGHVEAFIVNGLRMPGMPRLHCNKTLTFWGNMLAGAISRSCAQTAMHPANVIKTLLQTKGTKELANLTPQILMRGAGAQFVLSVPHGALAFAVLEATKATLSTAFPIRFAGPAFDFCASAVSTFICSVISTPQMVLTDRIMAGYYPNLVVGVKSVLSSSGVGGLYAGWFAALAQKIPSYGLTWVFFQQLKEARTRLMDHEATHTENFAMGALAAACTVTIMIPLDTIKTRIVTQAANPHALVHYKGVADCFLRIMREEGLSTFYKPLPPRLASVVPMIGIQFGVYEAMKRLIGKIPEPSTGAPVPPITSVGPVPGLSTDREVVELLEEQVEDNV